MRNGERQGDAEKRVSQWCVLGLLVHEVSLLSTHGSEEGMIDDMASVLNRLRVTLRIVSPSSSRGGDGLESNLRVVDVAPKALQQQKDEDTDAAQLGSLLVTLCVDSHEAFEWLAACSPSENGSVASGEPNSVDIRICPVLMTLGVNEFQTLANVTNATELQTRVNRQGVKELQRYHDAFIVFQQRRRQGGGSTVEALECDRLLSDLCDLVEQEAAGERRKIVDVLLVSCYAARLMYGARTTSCKSAKDRSSMFQSLESVRWAQRQGSLPVGEAAQQVGVEEDKVLELLRGAEGVRLQNCGDNIGKALYTFNTLQLTQLPSELRPRGSVSGAGKS